MKKVIEMTYKKSTKGTHVYESDSEACVTTIYIKKIGMPIAHEMITVTIESPEK